MHNNWHLTQERDSFPPDLALIADLQLRPSPRTDDGGDLEIVVQQLQGERDEEAAVETQPVCQTPTPRTENVICMKILLISN